MGFRWAQRALDERAPHRGQLRYMIQSIIQFRGMLLLNDAGASDSLFTFNALPQ